MALGESEKGGFAQRICEQMEKLELSITSVADQLGISYEHMRKICRGETFPSKFMLSPLGAILQLSEQELENLMVADKIRQKYGRIPTSISGKNPELEPLERIWPRLTESQKEELLVIARALTNWNRKKKAESEKTHEKRKT